MTTENNKIIAEFMGIADEIETGATSLIQIEGTTGYYKNDNLQFHTDWNWLMEVVEKIEKNYLVDIFGKAVSIHENNVEMIVDLNAINYTTKIEAVYNAVVTFIEWYNKNAVKN